MIAGQVGEEPRHTLVWAIASALSAVLLLVTVAVGLAWPPLARLDAAAAQAAFDATSGHEHRVEMWSLVSTWGGPDPMRAALLVTACIVALRRRVDLAVWLVALVALEAVVAPASKLVLARARPSWAHPITVLGSTSFPSGHATAAAMTAVALSILTRRPVVACCAGAIAVTVAASRVFLGVHYVSDVVGGVLLGSVLAFSTFAATVWARERWRARGTGSGDSD
jgi:membrane-associated phospholipid phosphatase